MHKEPMKVQELIEWLQKNAAKDDPLFLHDGLRIKYLIRFGSETERPFVLICADATNIQLKGN